MSPGAVDWRMKTVARERDIAYQLSFLVHSVCMWDSGMEWKEPYTIFISHTFSHCDTGLLIGVIQTHCLRKLNTEPVVSGSASARVLSTVLLYQVLGGQTYRQPASQAEDGYCP